MLFAALLLTGSLSSAVSSASAAIEITKEASRTESRPGQTVAFTITVRNTGLVPATVTMTDALPPNLTFVSMGATGGSCVQEGPVTVSCVATLSASEALTVTISTVGTDPGKWCNRAQARAGTTAFVDDTACGEIVMPVSDSDGDGVADPNDNCPDIPNPGQANTDGDAQGNACDADDDNDGVADGPDLCEGTSPGTVVAGDGCPDPDGDGISTHAGDNCPSVANDGQANTDGDGQGDACDADDDNDGVDDSADLCEGTPAGTTVAADGCPEPDPDPDGDGISTNAGDNCPDIANPDQANTDGDAQGDACDADDDNDNVVDGADNCQSTANPDQQDLDGDGMGSACDAVELPTGDDKEQCRNGGWMLFYDLDGPRFKNQGDCTKFVTRGPK
ncbi:MAG: DUF11 domain-containing protein [Solirubrobacteraceae bacterium]|nr:DUF11 domain-containing protein [Solirubrobacteraceae bacterium]